MLRRVFGLREHVHQASGAGGVLVDGERVDVRHDGGLTHHAGYVRARSGPRHGGVGAHQAQGFEAVDGVDARGDLVHDVGELGGVDLRPLDAVPIGLVQRLQHAEIELARDAPVVRRRDDGLGQLVFHAISERRSTHPVGDPTHEVEHDGRAVALRVQIGDRAPQLFELRRGEDRIVRRPVVIGRVGVIVRRLPVHHLVTDAPEPYAHRVQVVQRGFHGAVVPAVRVDGSAEAVHRLQHLGTVDQDLRARHAANAAHAELAAAGARSPRFRSARRGCRSAAVAACAGIDSARTSRAGARLTGTACMGLRAPAVAHGATGGIGAGRAGARAGARAATSGTNSRLVLVLIRRARRAHAERHAKIKAFSHRFSAHN